ncbi:MAG TPA: LamG-like jellyroll fold domain-containing protein [Candidatus Didemnitutus sp.]|nr:LamG-like jellyroll fold domain-containing protein [Candidatus Didemnitutus sp.]
MIPHPVGHWRSWSLLVGLGLAAISATVSADEPVRWVLDNTARIAGLTPEVLGAPKIVQSAAGDALEFDGTKDGIFLPANPLQGRTQFTIEVLFWPETGGPEQQRFVHLQDEAGSRGLIETRLDGKGGWWLDTFLWKSGEGKPLIDPQKVHPTGHWYWAALRYDGKTATHFVNGVQERQVDVEFGPMGPGRVSLGVRQNKVYWFKGRIREIRFHSTALAAEELQR